MLTIDSTGTPITGAAALVTGGHRGFDRGAAKVYTPPPAHPHTPPERRIVPPVLDVTDNDSVAAAALAAPDVSIVVNNAGISLNTPVLDAPLAAIRAELETNLFGTIRIARALSPIIARQPSSSLVNVLSVLSWHAYNKSYEISKAVAWSATNSMRVRLRDLGTVVTALHVAFMDTEITARLGVPKADPRDIPRRTADAIATGQFEVLPTKPPAPSSRCYPTTSPTSTNNLRQHERRLGPLAIEAARSPADTSPTQEGAEPIREPRRHLAAGTPSARTPLGSKTMGDERAADRRPPSSKRSSRPHRKRHSSPSEHASKRPRRLMEIDPDAPGVLDIPGALMVPACSHHGSPARRS
jgi:NAD(P)-dependent dehydrogenase (short-subunit alcohol dehydrogenase family)